MTTQLSFSYRMGMVSTGELIQLLIQKGPQKTLPRLTFYNFIKNFRAVTEPVTDSLFEDFLKFILRFQYWQERQRELVSLLREDLFPLLNASATIKDKDFLLYLAEAQIIYFKNHKDFEATYSRSMQKDQPAKSRFWSLPNKNILVLSALHNGQLKMEVYSPQALITSGLLKPLWPGTKIVYTESLEYAPNQLHWVEADVVTLGLWTQSLNGVEALFIKTPTLQKTENYSGPLIQNKTLFFSVKGYERYFVDFKTDPFYADLINQLERTIHLMESRHPNSEFAGRQTLNQGRTILRQLCPDDHLLMLLLNRLEQLMESPRLSPLQGP